MQQAIFNHALNAANLSTYYPYKVGAVVFKGKRIFSIGNNGTRHIRIHPKYQDWTNSCHAEQRALVGLDWKNLKGLSIIVVRMNMSGCISMARPCKKCYNLIRHVGIKNIYYSDRDGGITKEQVV